MIFPSRPVDDCVHDNLNEPSFNPQLSPDPFARLFVDGWHHHYHYQASAQYLWLAETLHLLGLAVEAQTAYTKAIFQDHGNLEAITGQAEKRHDAAYVPFYASHPESDALFCARVGRMPTAATALHDHAAQALANGDADEALGLLASAIALEPGHSNSHFLRGKCHYLLYVEQADRTRLEEARRAFQEAICLSHKDHDAYHRHASGEHLARGRHFLLQGDSELAIADFSKALDLYPGNAPARMARAEAYRSKGSTALAEADEREARSVAGDGRQDGGWKRSPM